MTQEQRLAHKRMLRSLPSRIHAIPFPDSRKRNYIFIHGRFFQTLASAMKAYHCGPDKMRRLLGE